MKLLFRAAVVSAAATALIATTAPFVSAAPSAPDSGYGQSFYIDNSQYENHDCVPVGYEAYAHYNPYYDQWYVNDMDRDGYSVRVRVWVDGSYKGTFYQADNGGSTVFDRTYPAGARVAAQLFLRKDSSGYFCGFATGGGVA